MIPGGGHDDQVAKRITDWTSGQPYMVQALCARLCDFPLPLDTEAVDHAVQQFIFNDAQHLPGLFMQLKNDPSLIDDLKALLQKPESLAANLHNNHFQLTRTIGILSDQVTAEVRNKIYQACLTIFLQSPDQFFAKRNADDNKPTSQNPPLPAITTIVNIQRADSLHFPALNPEEREADTDQVSQSTGSPSSPVAQKEYATMDPASIVISALLSGLVAGVSDTAKQFTSDIYQSFKSRLAKRLEDNDARVPPLCKFRRRRNCRK